MWGGILKHVILGIDPGTTTGFAVVSIKGDVLCYGSIKHAGLSQLLSRISSYGKVVVVATDKAKAPALARRLAARFNARIYKPLKDLSRLHKKRLLTMFNIKTDNTHEADAIAAGLHCWRSFKKSIEKLERFLKDLSLSNKLTTELQQELYAMLLKNHHWFIPKDFMQDFDKTSDNVKNIEQGVSNLGSPSIKKSEKPISFGKQNKAINQFVRMLLSHVEEVSIKNKSLLKQVHEMKQKIKILEENMAKRRPANELISVEKQRVRELQQIIKLKDHKIKEIENSNKELLKALLSLQNKTIIKYFHDPDLVHVLKANIQEGDVVVIESKHPIGKKIINILLNARAVFASQNNVPMLKHAGVRAFNKELIAEIKTEPIVQYDRFSILGCDYNVLEKALSKALLLEEFSTKYGLRKRAKKRV